MDRVRGIGWAIPVVTGAVLIGILVTAGLLGLRGSGHSADGGAPIATTAAPYGTPQRTGLVARLPLGQYGSFSWAPDGQHLLVRDDAGSRVYDRFGNLVSSFGQYEGWLDATHVISGDGHVAGIDEPYTGGPTSNSWVVAGGHGSAAIIVAVPGCIGDPMLDWYKNGGYVRAGEKATPYGWSPDGKLLLLGHMSCSEQEAQMHGWKGPVDVVDFATGRVLATAPDVRGSMAFNLSGTMLAAQSDADLGIVATAGGQAQTIVKARFLSWLDDNRIYYQVGSSVFLADVASGAAVTAIDAGEWQIPSTAGPRLVATGAGAVRRIVAADGTTTLLDLSSTGMVVDANQASDQMSSGLQHSPWSPDGRMLAIRSSDGTSVALISVTALPG